MSAPGSANSANSATSAVNGAPPPAPASTSNTQATSSSTSQTAAAGQGSPSGSTSADPTSNRGEQGSTPPPAGSASPDTTPATTSSLTNNATPLTSTSDSSPLVVDGISSASPTISQPNLPSLEVNNNSAIVSAPIPSPSAPGWPFNSTVAITLNSTSPMLQDMDSTYRYLKYDTETGSRLLDGSQAYSGVFTFRFVGTGFGFNGSTQIGGKHANDTQYTIGNDTMDWVTTGSLFMVKESNGRNPIRRFHPKIKSGQIGEMLDLNLRAYEFDIVWLPEAVVMFNNATIHIPYKSQATNFSAMQSQARYLPAAQGKGVNPFMSLSTCSVREELNRMYVQRDLPAPLFDNPTGPFFDVLDDHVVLQNSTELVYPVPRNTTLVEVLGPCGSNPAWLGDSECYAFLNPRPSWWTDGNFPVSQSRKLVNATNQTMFLLPLEPTVQYELRVGGLGTDQTCPVGGIRTYPFHYDFSADVANAASLNGTSATNGTNTNSSIPNSTPAVPSPSNFKKTSSTPIIVGVVVGVIGGLLLLGLALWYLRRRRRQQKASENELLPNPYMDDVEPRTKEELAQLARGEDPRAAALASQQAAGEEPPGEPRRRIVQEEDGQTIIEYLPPQYRDDWQAEVAPGPGPSPSSGPRSRAESGNEAPSQVEPVAAPIQDPALQEKVGRDIGNPDRPPLKQEYARTFGRALPQPPRALAAAGPSAPMDLRDEYKRQFGSSAHSSHGRGPSSVSDPNSAAPGLRDEYKRRFGSSAPQSDERGETPSDRYLEIERTAVNEGGASQQTEDLGDEYKRWFS